MNTIQKMLARTVTQTHFSRTKQWILPALALGLITAQSTAQTFTGEGNWKNAENWNTGIPADGATAIINGICEISENIGPANTFNPTRLVVGEGTGGVLNVTGGTLSGAHGGGLNGGIYVGSGAGGVGEMFIADGAAMRSQGGNMRVKIGDDEGGIGRLTIAGELLNYKFLEITNGTLEMLPTGINNKFNQLNTISTIGPNGTLAYVIDGDQVGALERANANGLNMEIDFEANLHITLLGEFEVGDSWTLIKYHTLDGEFAQGLSFTNQQGFTFDIDYGFGVDEELKITLTSTAAAPEINSLGTQPPAILAGESSTLEWSVGAFDSLGIDQGIGDVAGSTAGGRGSVEVSPAQTTTYTLTLRKSGIEIIDTVTVVVEEPPYIGLLEAGETLLVPGNSTTLRWKVDGATDISIAPDIGGVEPVGGISLTPGETTTYELTASNAYGTVTTEVTVIVDAVLAAITNRYDAGGTGNVDGFFNDQVGVNNFDLKSNMLDTSITSYTTHFTAANRLTGFSNDSGGDALGFPGGDITFEIWVRPGALDDGHQVLFETGGSGNGRCLLITQSAVRFLNSQDGTRTHDFEVSLENIDVVDFIQIVAVLDEANEQVALYVNGSAGGRIAGNSEGSLGAPNGRSTLFSWSSFSAGIAGALGGSAGTEPEGTTQFRGEIALLNVFGRVLTPREVEIQFNRHAVPDPGIIKSFTATPSRQDAGGTVTLAWEVGEFGTLDLDGVGDVSDMTNEGMGTLEITLDRSETFVLAATNAEGASVARVTVIVGVPADAILLTTNAETWDDATAWSDGLAPHKGGDYIFMDFFATRLATPNTSEPAFAGSSLEVRGSGTTLALQHEFESVAQVADLRLNGGTIALPHDAAWRSLGLGGGLSILSASQIDITGDSNNLQLDSTISGEAGLTVLMGVSDPDNIGPNLELNGANSQFSGGWTFSRGYTLASVEGSLGTGDIHLINGDLEIMYRLDSPDTTLNLQGNNALVTLDWNLSIGALNVIQDNGVSIAVPAGHYDEDAWQTFLDSHPSLGGEYFYFLDSVEVTVLGEDSFPIPGTTFTGEGNWKEVERWSQGVPLDGDIAVVNGIVEISGDVGTSSGDNPATIFIGDHKTGLLNVTGGMLSGAHTGSGIHVGVGRGGDGTVNIAEGAALRSQGGGMVVRIGDKQGGVGTVSVAGELFNFKFLEIINGTLEMMSTGLNRSFNSVDASVIGPQGTLAFVINGDQVGSLKRSNDTGLNLQIDPAANLVVTLTGQFALNDTWTLIDYTTLTGQFAQGTQFTNAQGHEFEIDYGTGDLNTLTLRLTSINPDATPPTISISHDAGQVVIEFTGTLEAAPALKGPWSEADGAVSPYTVVLDSSMKYFRSKK